MNVNILKANSVRSDKSLVKYFVTLEFVIDGIPIEIRDCRYTQKRDGGYFMGLPSTSYEDKHGVKRYYDFIRFRNKDDSFRVQGMMIKAMEDYLAGEQGYPPRDNPKEENPPF